MTAVEEQPRDDAGRFASYTRPPVPPAAPRPARAFDLDPVSVTRRLDAPVVRRLAPEVPTSVVAVCCADCVYGAQA